MTADAVTREAVMDLDIRLDERSERFRQEFRSWLAAHLPVDPEPLALEERFAYSRAWQRTLHAGGWAGISWPEEYGGRGASPSEQFVYYEELARAGAPRLINQPGVYLLGPTLMVHGPDELKRRFLPGILSGEDIWCQGFSEPEAGSDLAALRTRAELQGDRYVINGQKVWTSFALEADYCALLARSDTSAERHRGLSLLIVDLDQPGIEIRPIHQITAESEFGEVFYDDATAPSDWVVGAPGEGWAAAMTMLEFERSDQGFTDYAALLRQLEGTREVALTASAEGLLDGDAMGWFRQRYAAAWARCQLLRRFNLDVVEQRSAGGSVGYFGSVVKLYWSELTQELSRLALELDAEIGRHDDAGVHRYLHSRSDTIASGTSEIQRTIIAERLLGLPR